MAWNELWAAMQGIGTVGAVVVALGLEVKNSRRLSKAVAEAELQRREDELLRRKELQRSLYIELALRISEDFEKYQRADSGSTGRDAEIRIRASLAALPIAYLQVLRHQFDVYPDARDSGRIASYGQQRDAKARQEITALLYTLTGAGTAQDYEPPGSPTANRPKTPPEYP